MKGLKWRAFAVITSLLFCVYLLIPTFLKFGAGVTIPKMPKPEDPWYYSILPSETLKLGLDLSGGIHLVLGIDFEEVYDGAIQRLKSGVEQEIKRENITNVSATVTPDKRVKIDYPDEATGRKVDEILGRLFSQRIDISEQTDTTVVLTLSEFQINETRKSAIDQSLETLRNRIDEFGVAEPIITRHGDEKVLVQFPGKQKLEISRIKEIITRTAKLRFQLVVTDGGQHARGVPVPPAAGKPQIASPDFEQLNQFIEDFKNEKKPELSATNSIANYTRQIDEYLTGKVPEGTQVLFSRGTDRNTGETIYTPYLLLRDIIVTGEELETARQTYDQQGEPIVSFSLTASGAQKFAQVTGANIGRAMAIILDNNVYSAPNIQSQISSQGQITRGREPTETFEDQLNDAKDTALILRSGALPAKLEFLEERTLGPSLGEDSIRSGTLSIGLGLMLVLVFMAIYYRAAGTVAVLALALNGVYVLAAMAAVQGTLTLPGLAGLTLTLGMAVDANVLIFEHIREELRAGKSVNMSIAEGYRRAFSAILDSNLTTIMAAMVLLNFGYGPIKGFSVTLLIGLIASMFTAIFVTRLVFDYFVISKGRKSLSI